MGLLFNNQDIANAGVTEKAVLYSRSRFSWELSEIGAAKPDGARLLREAAAAFGRLCVETGNAQSGTPGVSAAAFGRLCVETTPHLTICLKCLAAAFGRLCVETENEVVSKIFVVQPPSGGCVLKQLFTAEKYGEQRAAAFGRLCVETPITPIGVPALRASSRLRAAVC